LGQLFSDIGAQFESVSFGEEIEVLGRIAASNGNPDEYFDFFAKRYGLKLSSNITEKLTQQIMNRRDVGANIGIRSTPSFMVNGEVHQGALPYRRWERIFDTILNEQ
jgi:hypothetical protein